MKDRDLIRIAIIHSVSNVKSHMLSELNSVRLSQDDQCKLSVMLKSSLQLMCKFR